MSQKNLEYRGARSTELHLVLLLWITATGLLWFAKIDAPTWSTVSEWTIIGYVAGRVGSKASEAYRDAKQPQSNYTPGVP